MSRKLRQITQLKSTGAELQTPGCLVASLGYSHLKANKLPADIAVVLWLPEAEAELRPGTLPQRLGSVLPTVHRLLMSADTPGASPPSAIFFVDCTPLIKVGRCDEDGDEGGDEEESAPAPIEVATVDAGEEDWGSKKKGKKGKGKKKVGDEVDHEASYSVR